MGTVTVKVQPEIIDWVVSFIPAGHMDETWVTRINQWLDGEKVPTFAQIKDLSHKANIPLGYFFLRTPPDENLTLLSYRTVNSRDVEKPSRNLIDTIHDMERVQQWMKEYYADNGYKNNLFVGCVKKDVGLKAIADSIRKQLSVSEKWYKEVHKTSEAFRIVRDSLENLGVIVMQNGVVGNNTHRKLSVSEFRAFAIVDDVAPLIFINSADSDNGRLFSILHEAAHIAIGESNLYNLGYGDDSSGAGSSEKICNYVAGEIIVPETEFKQLWCNSDKVDYDSKVCHLAGVFHCSQIVIARRAFDCGFINKHQYDGIVNKSDLEARKKSSGGNFYNNLRAKIDNNFLRALHESVNMGRTTYTEAFRLTHTNRNTYGAITE